MLLNMSVFQNYGFIMGGCYASPLLSLPGRLQSLPRRHPPIPPSPNCLSWAKWLIFNSQKDLNKLPFPLPLASSPSSFTPTPIQNFFSKTCSSFPSLKPLCTYVCLKWLLRSITKFGLLWLLLVLWDSSYMISLEHNDSYSAWLTDLLLTPQIISPVRPLGTYLLDPVTSLSWFTKKYTEEERNEKLSINK